MNRNDDNPQNQDLASGVDGTRQLSATGFAALGHGQVAYVRPANENGVPAFAVCSADGQQLAVVADRDVAFALIRQHDLEPVSVH